MYRITVLLLIIVIAFGFTSAQTTNTKTVTLAVTGMKCEMCVAKVDKALRGVDGVKDVKVSLEKKSAEVVLASTSVKSDVLLKAVADAGFAVSAGKLKMAAKKTDKESCDTDTMNKEAKMKKEGGPKEDCCKDGKKDEAAKKDDCCKDKETKKVETKN